MTDFITQYLTFAFTGLHEFCIASIPFGIVMMVSPRLNDAPLPKPAPIVKRTQKRKTAKRTVKKNLTVAKKPKRKAKKPVPMSPEQRAKLDGYYRRRDRIELNDNWAGGIPL
jgi:hypothetical protein